MENQAQLRIDLLSKINVSANNDFEVPVDGYIYFALDAKNNKKAELYINGTNTGIRTEDYGRGDNNLRGVSTLAPVYKGQIVKIVTTNNSTDSYFGYFYSCVTP